MSRKKKNKYRIVTDGLKMEMSLYADFCQSVSQKEIIETILISSRFFKTLESYRNGTREIELIPIRIHKEENK